MARPRLSKFNMAKIYDLIIVGAGPAGITASVYAARKRMDFIVLTGDIGGQAAWSGDIENYTGYQFITGPELAAKFEEHMKEYGVEVKEGEEVKELWKEDDIVHVKTGQDEYLSRTAIIASGKKSKELEVAGEKEFKNKGLTYCATCDGPLFSDKEVAVIGGGNSALDAVLQLTKIAKKIHIINNIPELGGDQIVRKKAEESDKVIVHNNSEVTAVLGEKFVSAIKIKKDGKEETISVQGVFVEIGLIPNSDFVKNLKKNDNNEIKVSCSNETNVAGIFAAGDVTDVPEKQIIVAAGDGAKAALSAFRYISRTSMESVNW